MFIFESIGKNVKNITIPTKFQNGNWVVLLPQIVPLIIQLAWMRYLVICGSLVQYNVSVANKDKFRQNFEGNSYTILIQNSEHITLQV